MLIVLFGESCTGKSTLANLLARKTGARVMTGRDYLKLAKGESDAQAAFVQLMQEKIQSEDLLITVFSEPEQVALVPQGALRVLVTAPLEVIFERFRTRMHGQLPPPVETMLGRKHGQMDNLPHDLHLVSGEQTPEEARDRVLALCRRT